jgi:hypothetical protein
LDLKSYIESGAIESYLLGLSDPEEIALLERMRNIYPELNFEISAMEYKLELAARAGSVPPPMRVWNGLSEQVNWKTTNKDRQQRNKDREEAAYAYINLEQPPRHTYIHVNIWWRCAFIALCMLVMALLASTIYFYRKYNELEERVLRMYPASQLPATSTK